MKKLLTITAIIEAGTGAGLLIAPSALARLLLGAPLDGSVALTVARVAGAGLLTIGVACWLARDSGRVLVVAMLFYNVAAVAILAYAAVGLALSGIGLWPAIGLHAALAFWCMKCLWSKRVDVTAPTQLL
jgi:hypothetical protein